MSRKFDKFTGLLSVQLTQELAKQLLAILDKANALKQIAGIQQDVLGAIAGGTRADGGRPRISAAGPGRGQG